MSQQAIQLLFGLVLGIYLTPSLVALFRVHPRSTKIVMVNALVGWTLAGWGMALWWSLRPAVVSAPRVGFAGATRSL